MPIKRAKSVCKVSKDELLTFKQLSAQKSALLEFIRVTKENENERWKEVRKKYKLEGSSHRMDLRTGEVFEA